MRRLIPWNMVAVSILSLQGASLQAQIWPEEGIVLDQLSRQPIAGAAVFINGTSVGTYAGEDGRFMLKNFPKTPYKLTVSAVGYESETMAIQPGTDRLFSVQLLPRAIMLSEVTIQAPDKNGWKRFGASFVEDFIGYSAFAQRCQILNPEALAFFYDEQKQVLRVQAEKPLRIRNQALGYLITYWLDDFEADYRQRTLYYRGNSQFQDLITAKTSKKQKQEWLRNRESAYKGSLQHFIRALFLDQLTENAFEVNALQRMRLETYYENTPKQTDTLPLHEEELEAICQQILQRGALSDNPMALQQTQRIVQRIKTEIRPWRLDSTDTSIKRYTLIDGSPPNKTYFEFRKDTLSPEIIRFSQYAANADIERQARNGFIQLLDSRLLSASELVNPLDHDSKIFAFPNYLHITYTGEMEEEAYSLRQYPFQKPISKPQTSVISIQNSPGVQIFANGYFESSYNLLLEGYWAYEKLDKLLPLEY